MCGLVGMMGNFFMKHEKMFRHMLLFDTLRGPHSTGVASVDKDRDIDIVKKTMPGWDFVEEPVLNQLLVATDKAWIGHNRMATVGKINRLNAHPFLVTDADDKAVLVGAHNGTLDNRYEAVDRAGDYGTDSEGLFNMIYHHGCKEAIARTRGAWALTWYDVERDAMRFLRNDKRPLFYAYVINGGDKKRRETIAWASEQWMLKVAAERAELDLSDIYYFEENILYEFPIPKKVGGDITFTREEDFGGKAEAPFQQSSQTVGNGYGGRSQVDFQRRVRWTQGKPEKWSESLKKWMPCEWDNQRREYVFTFPTETKKEGQETQEEIELRRAETQARNDESGNQSSQSQMSNASEHSEEAKRLEEQSTGLSPMTTQPRLSDQSSSSKSPSLPNIDRLKVKGFDGELLQAREAAAIFDGGCSWCGDVIPHRCGVPQTPVAWLNRTDCVCRDCVYDAHEKPREYTGLFDNELDQVQKGHAIITVDGGVRLKSEGLNDNEIIQAIEGRKAQEEARAPGKKKVSK